MSDENEERAWVPIEDPALAASLDQLAAYAEEHGGFEWTDPSLSPEEAAEADRLAQDALRRLRERT